MFFSFVLIILVINVPVVSTFGNMKTSWNYLIPQFIIDQIHAVEADDNLSPLGIERYINKALCTLPLSTLRLLDTPKYFQQLPGVAQWQIREVLYHPNMTYDMKQDIIADLVRRLPPESIRFPADKPNKMSMFFESYHAISYQIQFTFSLTELQSKLYSDDFAKIESVISNFSMPAVEQMQSISDILSKQWPEIQKNLFTDLIAKLKTSNANLLTPIFFNDFNEKLATTTKTP